MSLWIIEPRDPLVFGDGKPFSAVPGSRAKSLPFPHPSTVAGAMRTRSGTDPKGRFDSRRIDELLDTLLTLAELHEYTANPNRPALGTCVEAQQESGRGVGWGKMLKQPLARLFDQRQADTLEMGLHAKL